MMADNQTWQWYVSYNSTTNQTIQTAMMQFLTNDNPPTINYPSSSGYGVYLKDGSTVQFIVNDDHTMYQADYAWSYNMANISTGVSGLITVSHLQTSSAPQYLYYWISDLAGNWANFTLTFTVDFLPPVITLKFSS